MDAGMQKPQGLSYEEIRKTILEKIPADVGITRIEFEGPRLAIYTQKPETLVEQSHIVGEIAGIIKKRIVIRSDPSVRANELEAERIVKEILAEAGLVQSNFDPSLGEVTLEVEKPGVQQPSEATAPALPSDGAMLLRATFSVQGGTLVCAVRRGK